MRRRRRGLGCFDVGFIISLSYSESFTIRNIESGFEIRKLWNPLMYSALIDVVKDFPFLKPSSSVLLSLTDILRTFQQKRRTLLRDADVLQSSRVKLWRGTPSRVQI